MQATSRARARRPASRPGRGRRERLGPAASSSAQPSRVARGAAHRMARSRSSRASDCPRQPQPMIRQRATARGPSTGGAQLPGSDARAELLACLLARALGQPPCPSACVGHLQQLVELAVGEILLPARRCSLRSSITRSSRSWTVTSHFAAGPPPSVVGGEHLLEVFGLERLAVLGDLARARSPSCSSPLPG